MKLLLFFCTLLLRLSIGLADEDDIFFFAVETEEEDWDFCGLEYTETCPPTISIEEAACEAPLIVFGRVLQVEVGETTEMTRVQIHVNFRSEFFDVPKETVPKWGAGLENTDDTSIFKNNSGFFTTWVYGFNDTATDLAPAGVGTTPCGTRSPDAQEELYFFLDALEENDGVVASMDENNELNLNFQLSTSILQSGIADGTTDVYNLIESGLYNDDNRLFGTCRAIYCCYNPDCDGCDATLESVSDKFLCRFTEAPEDDDETGSNSDAAWSVLPSVWVMMTGWVATVALLTWTN